MLQAAIITVAIIGLVNGKADWSYSGANGPSHWVDNYLDCGKTHQSPIDLVTGSATRDYPGDFTWSGYEDFPADAMNSVINNGHTVKWIMPPSVQANVTGSRLGTTVYRLAQFHFHWGSVNTQGSEHTVEGMHAAAELHLVHCSTKYPSCNEAALEADGLAVFGILLQVAVDSNAVYNKLIEKLKDTNGEDDTSEQATFDVRTLMPTTKKDFFYYPGSLTTPGCYESVKWTVFKDPVFISQAQLDEFRKLRGTGDVQLVDNHRPVLALNDRIVKRSFDIPTDAAVNLGSLSILSTICLAFTTKFLL